MSSGYDNQEPGVSLSFTPRESQVRILHRPTTYNDLPKPESIPASRVIDGTAAPTFTYFIQPTDGGLIKIGRACDVRARLRDLQIGSPIRLQVIGIVLGDRESELHDRFAPLRAHGEWFHPAKELEDFIAREGKWFDAEVVSTGAGWDRLRSAINDVRALGMWIYHAIAAIEAYFAAEGVDCA